MSHDKIIDQAVQLAIEHKAVAPLEIGQTVATKLHKKAFTYLGEVDGEALMEYPGSGVQRFPADTVFDVNLCKDIALNLKGSILAANN